MDAAVGRATLIAAILGSGIVFLDSTVVTIAIRAIGEEPRVFLEQLEAQNYVHSAYLLTLASLLVLAGALSDRFGRRRVFAIGLVGFGATSLLCGLAPNLELLIVFRALQGAAGAILVPGSLALIRATFSGEEQGRAVGIWSGASAATTILGPLVGGLLVDGVSWRAVFLVNLPLVAVALWGLRRVPESRDERHPGRFDWLGAVLVALAVGGLSFGAIFGEQRQWRDPTAFAALGLGALCAVALPFYFARVRAPLVPLELFRSRAFSVVNLSTLVIYGALYVALFYQPLMLQTTLGYTAAGAGLAGLPTSLFLVFFSTRFGRLAARHGARRFMTAGPLVMAAGLLWFARLPGDSDPWLVGGDPATWLPPADYVVDVLPAVLFFGFGLTMLVAPLVTALLASIPARNAGLGSAINNAISRVGPQLVGAIVFIAITASFYTGLAARVPGLDPDSGEVRRRFAPLNAPAPDATPAEVGAARAASTDAFHLAMLVSAAFLAVGAVVNGAGLRDEPPTDEAGAVEAAAAAAG